MAWVSALGSMASAAYSAYESNQAANNKAAMTAEQMQQDFQNQIYRDQEQRKYALEDRNAKIKAVQGFSKYAPDSAMNFQGKGPPPVEQLNDTSNLDQFNPSQLDNSKDDSLMAYMRAHPDGN